MKDTVTIADVRRAARLVGLKLSPEQGESVRSHLEGRLAGAEELGNYACPPTLTGVSPISDGADNEQ